MAHTHPQGHAALLAARMAALTAGRHEGWTLEQLFAAMGEHVLCIVRFDDGRWAVRVSHAPGEAQENRVAWHEGQTLREALELGLVCLAADGGDA